ncbi:MAG: hypothetical protein ACREF3_18630, partial [Acetobacteraceae bacterium]
AGICASSVMISVGWLVHCLCVSFWLMRANEGAAHGEPVDIEMQMVIHPHLDARGVASMAARSDPDVHRQTGRRPVKCVL